VTSLIEFRLALALEAAQLGTWTWDMAAGTTTWDVRLEELHGLPPGGFGGTFEDWLASLHPEDRAECLARVERALASPGPYVLLHRTIWRDGSVHHIECRGTVLTDEGGAPTGTTGVAIDVTDREQHRVATSEALARERDLVGVLQQALLPTSLPEVPGTTIGVRYIPAQSDAGVGGDWYAVLPLSGGRLGLAIGDVAGHGVGAVADMAAARFSLRALALTDPVAPERVLERLNNVVRVFESDTMITALYGVLDPVAHTWTYASAGHCPALVRNPDGTTEWLDDECDPPLGVATSFRRRRANIAPGSMLVFYTDGLVERRTESIDCGMDRLRRACEAGPDTPDALCTRLSEVMLGDGSVQDDVAIVVVAVT
jgi:PAS domain S-box-containing protein